jgi:hydroxymethylpyrimidine pyrophosphatase-like HAD family hydrolase
MRPLAALDRAAARDLAGLFTDIDDTLTLDGRLVPAAYRALCDAADAGLRVVAVTGRPGGWAEVLATLWPVAAVVAENGALAVLRSGERRFWDEAAVRAEQRSRLDALRADLLARLPFARLAEDQPLRRVDVAFDVGERQHLDGAQIATLVEAIRAHGARTLLSTVHAHAFYGDHDKAAMLLRLAGELWGDDEATLRRRYLFVGDSPNDQAGFTFFPLSVGVANVARFAGRLAPPPAFITDGAGGHGFAELVDRLLALRG